MSESQSRWTQFLQQTQAQMVSEMNHLMGEEKATRLRSQISDQLHQGLQGLIHQLQSLDELTTETTVEASTETTVKASTEATVEASSEPKSQLSEVVPETSLPSLIEVSPEEEMMTASATSQIPLIEENDSTNEIQGEEMAMGMAISRAPERLVPDYPYPGREVELVVEIREGSRGKYELNPKTGRMRLDRFLDGYCSTYPFKYGEIIETLGGDGDPLDVVVVCKYPIEFGCEMRGKVIGALETYDEKGRDDKLIVVPVDKSDRDSVKINDITDLSERRRDEIYDFFAHYKKREKGKESHVGNFLSASQAMKLVHEAHRNYHLRQHEQVEQVLDEVLYGTSSS